MKPAFVAAQELRARRDRFAIFARLCAGLKRPLCILDVGGTTQYWQDQDWQSLNAEITLLNLSLETVQDPFISVVGDARDLSRYPDKAFDVVHSNSVLSLVGGFDDQLRMASEVRRVGRAYFVQTPNRQFPLDWRTLVPFFHWLPAATQARCFQRMRVGLYPRMDSYTDALYAASRVRDVTESELRMLFPDGTVVKERIAGLTKSFIVHNFG